MAARQASAESVQELSPFYYRDNFIALCDTVQERYGDLLQPCEQQILTSFRAMEHACQCLYVRLLCRVGPLFRVAKLEYHEIGLLSGPVSALIERNLAAPVNALTLAEMSRLYTAGELFSVFGPLCEAPPRGRKSELLEIIERLNLSSEEHFSQLGGAFEGEVIRIEGGPALTVLQLLFFGNRHQSLTDFVLSDLGVARHYPYRLDPAQRLFSSRAAVEEYLLCSEISDAFHELREAKDGRGIALLGREVLARNIEFASTQGRWQRLCITLGRQLERQGETDLALGLYRLCEIHPARERSVRILESQKKWPEVLAGCDTIAREPWCEAELEAAQRVHRRAVRHTQGKAQPKVRDDFAEMHLTAAEHAAGVEQAVAQCLLPDWSSVHYVENRLMNSLFGLAFWEQIFQDSPGAFHNPYQSLPADMYNGGFRALRAREIDSRLQALRTTNLAQELARAWERVNGYQCRWLDWSLMTAELLETSLAIIPAEHLLAIWQRQLFDPRENRSGFPDLIAFGEQPGDYCMIEVKGPGDRLQDNQKRWLRYFSAREIPAKVAWVQWANV